MAQSLSAQLVAAAFLLFISVARSQAPSDAATAAPDATTPTTGSTSPAAAAPEPSPSPTAVSPLNTTSNATVRVDQVVPSFTGIRSCLPFNILVAAPQPGSAADSTSNGRISIIADASVINSTQAAIENGILTLSLTGGGFYSDQPINFTVTAPPGGKLQSVSNYGSGLVVLGPGLNASSLRINAQSVGQIRAINIVVDSLTFSGSGILGSSLEGAFNRVSVTTGAATGNLGVISATPVRMTVDLGGITTLLVNAPTGTSITGSAGGLSKVQYTAGTCNVGSQTGFGFPTSSFFGSFGGGGGLFGSKCQQVSAGAITRTLASTDPLWTCGMIVDGQLSCAGPRTNSSQPIAFNIPSTTAVTTPVSSPAPSSPSPSLAASPEPSPSPQLTSTAAQPALANETAASPAPTTTAIGGAAGGSPAPNAAAATAGPAQGTGTGSNVATVQTEPPATGAGTTTGTRRLLQRTVDEGKALAGRRLAQSPVTTNVSSPPGTLTTGASTSGSGSYASGTSSVSGPGGGTYQTTTSQQGGAPTTSGGTFNPVYIPSVPATEFETSPSSSPSPSPSLASPSPASPAPSSPAAGTFATSASPLPSPSAAVGSISPAPTATSVKISTTAPGTASGVAVVNTACAGNATSLSMLQPAASSAGA